MTHFLFLIVVFAGVVVYFMTRDERIRLLRMLVAASGKVKETVTLEGLQGGEFFDALRARTPRIVATPALIALSAITFMFVHSPLLDLCISAACLWQIGLILERLLGRVAFTTVYVASGAAAAIASLSASPGDMRVAASASVLGMYGVLLITSIWSTIRGVDLTIPLNVTTRLASVAAVFVLYKLTTTGLANRADLAAIVCGLVAGIVLARDVYERTPRVRQLATAMAAVITVVSLYAATMLYRPLKEGIDIRPEIVRVITVEDRTASLYEKEIDRFRKGRISAAALADVIERAIVPELRAVAVRLRGLQDVPAEQQGLIATAETFLKLRDESWQLRAAALHKSDMRALRHADTKEQASREAFKRLKIPLSQDPAGQPSS